jgi:hypothetical protein
VEEQATVEENETSPGSIPSPRILGRKESDQLWGKYFRHPVDARVVAGLWRFLGER